MSRSRRLVVFFIPPEKIVNGGILSIFSICKVSRQFEDIHKSEVLLCTYPGTKSYKKNDLFENDEHIYSFDEIVQRAPLQSLQLHIPEYASYDTQQALKKYRQFLGSIPELSVNILNQNILLMQPPLEVANWFSFTPHVTQTTAHNKYTNQELADAYNIPVHHLSTFVDARQYQWIPYQSKENLIVLSPDISKKKDQIVKKLEAHFPNYQILTIQNMTYETYKDTMSKARFALTFGEGFDGYFVEAFFSGGLCYAVYNEDFFPDKDFATFENTFSSYDDMLHHLISRMKQHDEKKLYEKIVNQNLHKINTLYSFDKYTKNVKNFYLKQYTYTPTYIGGAKLLGALIEERDSLLSEKESIIQNRDKKIDRLGHELGLRDNIIHERDRVLNEMLQSHSWKVTKPLRYASSRIQKHKS